MPQDVPSDVPAEHEHKISVSFHQYDPWGEMRPSVVLRFWLRCGKRMMDLHGGGGGKNPIPNFGEGQNRTFGSQSSEKRLKAKKIIKFGGQLGENFRPLKHRIGQWLNYCDGQAELLVNSLEKVKQTNRGKAEDD